MKVVSVLSVLVPLLLFNGTPFLLPLQDEGTYFRYQGNFEVYAPLGGKYNLSANLTEIRFKGTLLVTVERNFVDYVVYSLVVEPNEEIPPELERLIGGETLVRVSREGGNIYIDGQELPFLLVIDMEYIMSSKPVYNVTFGGLTNFTLSDLELVESEKYRGALRLQTGNSKLSTIVPIGRGYLFSVVLEPGYITVIGTYSKYGYAIGYSYFLIPFFDKGLAIDFRGRLVDTNAERDEPDIVSLVLEGYLRFLVLSLGPIGFILYYASLISAAGLIAILIALILRRLRR